MNPYLSGYKKLHAASEGFLVDGKPQGPSAKLFDGSNFIKKLYGDFAMLVDFSTKGVRVLDYGCGKAKHLHQPVIEGKWTLHQKFGGKIQSYYCYDPGYEPYSTPPSLLTKFDIVICADVMEHVPEDEIVEAFHDLWDYTHDDSVILFTISGKPARKAFLDGTNLHCSLYSFERWVDLLDYHFPNRAYKLIYDNEEGERVYTSTHYNRIARTL